MGLRVDDLTVYYQSLRGDVKAVDGATFEIADGEIMGLAGESGCGKSTLGKSLIRLDTRMRYVRGSVVLDGVELPVWDDRRMNAYRFKSVSLIPQYALSALNPTRRIGTMVTELLASRDVALDTVLPELRRRIELVDLPGDVLQRFPIELSGGMKQRVVMVVSSLLDPSLLIADEVTSALDVSTQRAVAELLVEFRNRGFVRSMIVITHDLSVLYQIADTVLIMYAGKLAEKAPTEVIVEAAKHPYTDLLLSTLPEVGVRFAERRLHGIPGRPPSLLEPPAGCRFRARCPFADDTCLDEPPFVEVEPGCTVACWKVARVFEAAPLQEAARC